MVAVGRALILAPRVASSTSRPPGSRPRSSLRARDQARALADRGKAVLLVEQRAHAALELSDWAYVLVGRRIAVSATASQVLADPEMGEVFLGGQVKA